MLFRSLTLAAVTSRVMAAGSTSIEVARLDTKLPASKLSTVPATVIIRTTLVWDTPPGVSGGGEGGGEGGGGDGGGGEGGGLGGGGDGGGGEGGGLGGGGGAYISSSSIHARKPKPFFATVMRSPSATTGVLNW